MDHNEAIQLQAAVKYVLGELSQVQREEYEEHYFDCVQCATELKAAAAFVDSSREIFKADKEGAAEREAAPVRGGRFGWLGPIVAVPAFAALVLVVTYQNVVTIPRAKEEAARGTGQLFTSSFSLQVANTRGGEEVKVQVHPKESFALNFDFTPSQIIDSYVCQLQDEAGRSLLQVNVPGASANKEAHLVVPGELVRPGKYRLVFFGGPGSQRQPVRDEVLHLNFAIEFLQ